MRPVRTRLPSLALLTMTLAGLLVAPPVPADTYRWTDEDGKVHYNKSLPPDRADKPYDILNDQGLVIERVTDPRKREQAPDKSDREAELEQARREEAERRVVDERRRQADRLLVLKYHSEEELLDAMQVEINQLGYDRRLLDQSRESMMNSLAGQVREAADRQRAGMDLPPEQVAEIRDTRRRLEQNRNRLVALEDRETRIRSMFEGELARYRLLTGEDAALLEADPAAADIADEPGADAETSTPDPAGGDTADGAP